MRPLVRFAATGDNVEGRRITESSHVISDVPIMGLVVAELIKWDGSVFVMIGWYAHGQDISLDQFFA